MVKTLLIKARTTTSNHTSQSRGARYFSACFIDWIALMLSWSAYAINSSTCLMPFDARLRDFINQTDAVGVTDFADKCLALFDH